MLFYSNTELYITIALTIIIVLFSIIFYHQNFAILYSSNESKVSNIKVNQLTIFQDLLLSITIAIASKIVGSLVVSSLIVLPVACGLQLKKGYKITMIASIIISNISMVSGLTISYYASLKPGATIVAVSIGILIILFIYKKITEKVRQKKQQ